MRNVVLVGDVREKLMELPDQIVQTCVTSPPYWGLRDYGTSSWEGGDPACEHRHETKHQQQGATSQRSGRQNVDAQRNENFKRQCQCGAVRIDQQLGLEPTPEEYVAAMVEVFREVRRVLRDDGTLWLVLGDTYAANRPHQVPSTKGGPKHSPAQGFQGSEMHVPEGLKPKDLVGIPWMMAFALRADGWWLRSDIIWAKGNVMPESVRDRPTKCHEYIFLLTKSERYYYDVDAIREPHNLDYVQRRLTFDNARSEHFRPDRRPDMSLRYDGVPMGNPLGRNKRTVWNINPKPYKEAHFATFPEEIPNVCIKAGTSEHGSCASCGAPYDRIVERVVPSDPGRGDDSKLRDAVGLSARTALRQLGGNYQKQLDANPPETIGWDPSCQCGAAIVPCVVLDPFAGSGTTLAVAKYLRRDYVGVELNPEYVKLIEARLSPAEALEADRQVFDYMMDIEDG